MKGHAAGCAPTPSISKPVLQAEAEKQQGSGHTVPCSLLQSLTHIILGTGLAAMALSLSLLAWMRVDYHSSCSGKVCELVSEPFSSTISKQPVLC